MDDTHGYDMVFSVCVCSFSSSPPPLPPSSSHHSSHYIFIPHHHRPHHPTYHSSIHPSIHPSIQSFTLSFICRSIDPSPIHPSINPSIHPSIHLLHRIASYRVASHRSSIRRVRHSKAPFVRAFQASWRCLFFLDRTPPGRPHGRARFFERVIIQSFRCFA